jgi:hypothetical protein
MLRRLQLMRVPPAVPWPPGGRRLSRHCFSPQAHTIMGKPACAGAADDTPPALPRRRNLCPPMDHRRCAAGAGHRVARSSSPAWPLPRSSSLWDTVRLGWMCCRIYCSSWALCCTCLGMAGTAESMPVNTRANHPCSAFARPSKESHAWRRIELLPISLWR